MITCEVTFVAPRKIRADAGLPEMPWSELTIDVVLSLVPGAVAVTFTVNVQYAPAARLAADSVIVPVPEVAVIVPPPQEPVTPLGVATVRPVGKMSVNVTPVKAVFPLVRLNVREVVAPTGIASSPNVFVRTGEGTSLRKV